MDSQEKALLRLARTLGIRAGTADEIVDSAISRLGPEPKFMISQQVRVVGQYRHRSQFHHWIIRRSRWFFGFGEYLV